MARHDPASASPPPRTDRDPGDAWVLGPGGERYWGRYGAAGVLVHDDARGVLLQHRALWSHHGGTWGIPGGALHEGESAIDGAMREALEEATVPRRAVEPTCTLVVDRQVWRYTTVVAHAVHAFTPAPADAESLELRWVPVQDVSQLALHPAFRSAWSQLAGMIGPRPRVIVDAANVIGSRPDGWWKDRRAAVERLADRLSSWSQDGVDASALGLPGDRWFPRLEMVTEGSGRGGSIPDGLVHTEAPRDGDATIVARASMAIGAAERVVVVTSDRALRDRVAACGAEVWSAGRLLRLLDGADPS
ncbi:NUDIX domain-containing protein [Demequina sp. NBRC 110053]|uniref:NUDIX domain-containing protein n=1 Tax=Demequina sp. NBRC 110053 TaxID=1570342 RepID=UPI0009FD30AD|nr:NUDIX domain-containing protein [Demequina sp. NBRC 110053]